MKTCFRYPGSKAKLLPVIEPFIEKSLEHSSSFADLFVGGGSVLLDVAEDYPDKELIINDKDPFIYSFWKVMANGSSGELEELCALLDQQPTIDLFYQLRATEPTSLVKRAYYSIFFNRTCFSGIASAGPIGGKLQESKYKVDCRYNAKKLKTSVSKISQLLAGRTIVHNQDILQALTTVTGATYLDPPYWEKGPALYPVHMPEAEHIALSLLLKEKENWILSYDDCPETREMYKYANVNTIDANYCINGKKTSWVKKSELLITSVD